jgi:hypothetical protein
VKIKIVYWGFHLEVTLSKKINAAALALKIILTIKCVLYDQNMTASKQTLAVKNIFVLIVKVHIF